MLEELTQVICLPAWFVFVCACGTIFGAAGVTWLWLTLLRNIEGHTQNMVLTMVKFPTMQVAADSILARVTKKAHQRTNRPITLKEKKARTKP